MILCRKTTFVWSLCVGILVVITTASDSNGFSTKDSGIGLSLELLSTTDTVVSSEKSPQQNADKCLSSTDCRNGGLCLKDKDGSNYCKCKKGTSGDTCEVVDDCVRYPMPCGVFKDVDCVYDLVKQKAKCKCNDESKQFDSYLEKCRVPCVSRKECPENTLCRRQPGDDSGFCRCYLETGGDRCENHDLNQCQDRGLDCGTNPNVTCAVGTKGPVCYCHDWSEGYNYQAKDCLKCDCEGSNLGCQWFPNGTKECYCQKFYYQEGDKCKDCKCGFGANGCKLENRKKKCNCWARYLDNDGVCEECYCGENQVDCTFKEKKKSCTCKTGYVEFNGTCRRNCNVWSVFCKNGGKCVDSVCQCLPGTSGDVCEVIKGCETWSEVKAKCGFSIYSDDDEASCDFNVTSVKAYCRCKKRGYLFDEQSKKCKACDCGIFGRCYFVEKEKTCSCDEGYSVKPATWDRPSKCELCKCGEQSISCDFSSSGDKLCLCKKGYSQKGDTCEECNCGDNGSCSYDIWNRKQCHCRYGYVERKGSCVKCNCGLDGKCGFDKDGSKQCVCNEGYGYDGEECVECDCWLDSKVIGCVFKNKKKTCSCPEGYKADTRFCRDINECLNRTACPRNTTCRNTKGSYTCSCDRGYRPHSDKHDPKLYGCIEINECVENTACPYRDTSECVKTLSGYYCRCKSGYSSPYSTYTIEMRGCEEDQTGWKVGYIILIVVFIIAFTALLIAIKNKYVP